MGKAVAALLICLLILGSAYSVSSGNISYCPIMGKSAGAPHGDCHPSREMAECFCKSSPNHWYSANVNNERFYLLSSAPAARQPEIDCSKSLAFRTAIEVSVRMTDVPAYLINVSFLH